MGKVSFFSVLVSFLVAVSLKRAEALNYTVGDMTGWTVPAYDDFYDDWNDNKPFTVGDLLIFNWTGDNNVVEVTEQQYDMCANVTIGVRTTSPAVFILTTAGDYHFISTVGNNCLRGQKLEIEVDRALLTPPATPPPPPPPVARSPPPMMSPTPAPPVKAPAPAPASTGATAPPTSSPTSGSAKPPASAGTSVPGSADSPASTGAAMSPPPRSSSPASFVPAVGLSAAALTVVGLFL